MGKPLIVLQTDFTYKEGAVCSMKGVMKSVDRTLEIIDGTHEIPQYDTWGASYRLYQSMRFWPKGTIFVSVVDPGVGTSRKGCVAKTEDGYYVVTPDNGSLTHIAKFHKIVEIREIDQTVNRLKNKNTEDVAIFHGRDVFGYCAARLASGIISYEEVGPSYPISQMVLHPMPDPITMEHGIEGMIEIDDPNFGNLWTNIPLKLMKDCGFAYGDYVNVEISYQENIYFQERVLFHQAFGFVKEKEPILYNNELSNVAIALSCDSFKNKYHCKSGSGWKVRITKE